MNLQEATMKALQGKLQEVEYTDEQALKTYRELRTTLYDEIEELVSETYIALEKIEKPDSYSIGGTYYNSTELRSSVGNMLEIIEREWYTSYEYVSSTNYYIWSALKIGGAYEKVEEAKNIIENFRIELQKLKKDVDELDDMIKKYPYIAKIIGFKRYHHILDTDGTNWTLHGLGWIDYSIENK